MRFLTRRHFLTASLLGGLGGVMSGNKLMAGGDMPPLPPDPQQADDTLFLTWANDPCRTMRIQWLMPQAPNEPTPSILFREAGKNQNVAQKIEGVRFPFGPSDWYVNRIDLKDLQPGTLYTFELSEPFAQGKKLTYSFLTAPAKLEQELVFASGGDIGIDPKNVLPLHQQAASWNPLFGFVGGDLSYSNGKDVRIELAYFRYWRQGMITTSGRLIPMITAIGNHEVVGGFGKKPKDAPFFYALFDGLFDPTKGAYNTLDFGDYFSLVILDSGHTATVSEQTEWLKSTLNTRANVKHKIVAYHVPGYPSVRNFMESVSVEVRQQWIPILEQANIPLALEHHDHAYKRTYPLIAGEHKPSGVIYLGDGAWGRNPRKQKPMSEMPWMEKALSSLNVIQIRLTPEKSSFLTVNHKGEQLDSFEIPLKSKQ